MYKVLSEVNYPKDIKNKSIKELTRLSVEIRDFLLKSISKTGGHLASNLGVVELTIALHFVFESPKDKLIWDVGHQCYTHKILTGRKNKFDSLRKLDGISGFIKKDESPHDIFQAGHSSTSISAAVGMAKARDNDNLDYDIIPIIGDGAMTGGMAFEALNFLGHSKENVIVCLNDNGMSIDENVGAISKSLTSFRNSKTYDLVKKDAKLIIEKIPIFGNKISTKISKLKKSFKYMILPDVLFEDLGFKYLGPVDGHNIEELIKVFEKAKQCTGPTLVHILTTKGKGYLPAEEKPRDFHGVGKFNLNKNKIKEKTSVVKYSNVFGKKICELASLNKNIFAITSAMPAGTGLLPFKDKFPDRYIDSGIAEQHATTLAAGLANSNKKPFFAIYSTFLQRAYDQVLHDVCIQKLPVVFCIDRAGIVGADGETHHGVFDISYLSSMPNMMILAPKDGFELERMLEFAEKYKDGPIAIRYPRGEKTEINKDLSSVIDFEVLNEGENIIILALGKMVSIALDVKDKLENEKGLNIKVINQRIVKPIDFKKLKNEFNNIKYIVTLEDNVKIGGFGSIISQEFGNDYKIFNIGYNDKFIEHGDTDKLFKLNGLDANSIVKKILNFVDTRRGNEIF